MVMAIVYLVTTVAWGFLLYRFRDGLLGLQVLSLSLSSPLLFRMRVWCGRVRVRS
jgi:hypothetical protein